MFSSLLSLPIIAAVIIAVAHARRTTPNACKTYVSSVNPCHLSVSVNSECKSAIVQFPGTNFTNKCNSANIFWNYPKNNLTFIIDTPFTAKCQPYTLRLNVLPLNPELFRVFQVQRDGVTTELKFQSGTVTVKSDSYFQVGLKFQGPSRFIVYGVFIRYNIFRV